MRPITEADSLTTTGEVAEEINTDHSMVTQHLKQTAKVKKLGKWRPRQLTKINKSGFYTTIGDNQLSGWAKKQLQSSSQSQTCTQKRSWSLSGGLLLD